MSGFVSFLVYFCIIVVIISRLKKAKKKADKPINQRTVVTREISGQSYKKNKASGINAHMSREKTNVRGWEDRRNDWLAEQMEEERQALKRVSEMFQLKMEHRYNCEAEMLKQFHESRCDADKVDTAEK